MRVTESERCPDCTYVDATSHSDDRPHYIVLSCCSKHLEDIRQRLIDMSGPIEL